jgi:hypothetical protein
MRYWIAACCGLLVGTCQAAEAVYQRGDFRFQVSPEPAYVTRFDFPERWDPSAPGASGATWRVWRYDRQIDQRQGAASYYIDYAYEPKTSSMLGEAGKYQIRFNPEYQQLFIHRVELRRNGHWENRLDPEHISLARREGGFENDLADGEVTALIVLDDIRVDDVLRVAFTITGSNPILKGQDSDTMYFGWQSPLLDARFRVLADTGTRFAVRRENGAPEAVERASPDGAEIQFHAHGMAGVTDEANYPVWYQPYPRVQVSKQRNWDEVVAWALPLYPAVTATFPADLEARIKEWRRLPTQEARLTAALRAIQDEVRYFGVEMGENTHRPAAPGETWRRRRGDCKDKAYLLTTILNRLGISSAPALTSIREGRAVQDMIPSAYDFDHVIVRAVVDGRPLWVDPTISQQGGTAMDSDLDRYGAVLPLMPGVSALEAISASRGPDGSTEVVESYAPPTDGKQVPLEVRTTYRGQVADQRRAGFSSERIADVSRRYADFYRKRFGEIDVVSDPVVNDDRATNVLTVVERYVLANPFEDEGASVRGLALRADAIEGVSALPSTIDRKGPLQFAMLGRYRHEVRVRIPPGWRPTFGAENESVKASSFDYERGVEVKDGEARLVHNMDVVGEVIDPAQTSAHVGELRKVRDSLGAQLRFRTAIPADPDARARRLKALLEDVGAEGEKP